MFQPGCCHHMQHIALIFCEICTAFEAQPTVCMSTDARMVSSSDCVEPEFVGSLAVAGTSGTIRSRFGDSPAQSRLRAKTGSLTGVSALSGYVESQNGEVLAFSVMMNDYRGRARAMWGIQDQIGVALARHRGGTEAVAAGATAAP